MSGETPPGRFQSMSKKFAGSMSPGPNSHSPNGRGGHNRSRVLTNKVSAPRPMNLPSLRREHATGADWPASGGVNNNTNSSSSTMNTTTTTATPSASNSGTTGWGSSPSLSPFAAPQKWDNDVKAAEWPATSQSPELQSSSSPVPKVSSPPDASSPNSSPHPAASRAWAAVSATSTPALSTEFPTAAETTTQENNTAITTTAHADKNRKSDIKQAEKSPENDKKDILETEHLDWDEIVRQDLENDDLTATAENETVLPSDRFTEDYDRSYPPQIHSVNKDAQLHAPSSSSHNSSYHHHHPPLSSSPSQQHHHFHPTSGSPSSGYHNKNGGGGNYSRRDNTWGNHHEWNGYSRSNNQERRQSIDRTGGGGGNDGNTWGNRGRRDSYSSDQGSGRGGRGGGRFGNRRPSHDRKANFQPTVLQRPRRMSELSARSDRSASRDESVESSPQSQQQQQQQAITSSVVLPAVIEQDNGEVSSSSSPGHRYTAAQREVMLTAAERAKKRRDEEEAEFEAARERARKKAEALAAQCESKPKSSPDKKKTEDINTTSDKPSTEVSDSIATASSQDKPSAPTVDKSTLVSAETTAKSSDTNQKPAQKEEQALESKEHKEKDPATIPDSDSPRANDDGKASSSWSQIRSDKPHQLEDEEDNQRWEEYVKGIQNHKSDEAKSSNDNAAAGWNDYANRLQTSTEIRMNAAIDKFAADRNIDPALLEGMRPKDREPLRLQRPNRDNNMGSNMGGRRDRNGDRRQHHNRDDGRRDTATNGKKLEQPISPVEQHQLNFESWPSLGETQPTNNKPNQQQKTEQKVLLNGEDNNSSKKKKKQSKDKKVNEKKTLGGSLLDHKEEGKQEENGTIVTITTTENMDELSEKSKNNSNIEKCTDEDENGRLKLSERDEKVGVSKMGSSSFVVAENVITTTTTTSTDSSNDLSKDDHQEKEEKKEAAQVTDSMDGSMVDMNENDDHQQKPEEDIEEFVPEMTEASESGSPVSHNITDTVPTPESESFVGPARTYSAMAVFEHRTRAERHDFLQKSKECIFPEAIERLAEMKPATLTFRTVSDDSQQTNITEPLFDDTQSSPQIIDHGNQFPPTNEYMTDQMHALAATAPLDGGSGVPQAQVPYTVSPFDGKVSPQFMPPMTMAGRQNFPLLVYQVPYNGQAPFMPGSPNAAGGYGMTTTDNQQPMFIPAPIPQQFQGQPSQQQPMMGVYLLSPNQMLPPWPGMPVKNNNNTTNNNSHNNNQQQRRRR